MRSCSISRFNRTNSQEDFYPLEEITLKRTEDPTMIFIFIILSLRLSHSFCTRLFCMYIILYRLTSLPLSVPQIPLPKLLVHVI